MSNQTKRYLALLTVNFILCTYLSSWQLASFITSSFLFNYLVLGFFSQTKAYLFISIMGVGFLVSMTVLYFNWYHTWFYQGVGPHEMGYLVTAFIPAFTVVAALFELASRTGKRKRVENYPG